MSTIAKRGDNTTRVVQNYHTCELCKKSGVGVVRVLYLSSVKGSLRMRKNWVWRHWQGCLS